MSEKLEPIHPGEILLEDFMKPNGHTICYLAREANVPLTVLEQFIRGKSVSPVWCRKISVHYALTKDFFKNIQEEYKNRKT